VRRGERGGWRGGVNVKSGDRIGRSGRGGEWVSVVEGYGAEREEALSEMGEGREWDRKDQA